MRDGFTYNGIHCSEYGVEYNPDPQQLWWNSPEFNVYSEEVAGKDGGYYYGNDAKVRTFTLPCWFEDITIEQREMIRMWLDKDTAGELIFDDRPFVAYHVRPTNVVTGALYAVPDGRYSGTFTITFSAFEQPYGLMLYSSYEDVDIEGAEQYSGILKESELPDAPTTSSRDFLFYNCGTQTCGTVLEIGGSGTNITITNNTNGTACRLVELPSTGYLEIDGERGLVTWVNGTQRVIFFEYHNEGYMTLAPFLPKLFHVMVSYTAGSDTVTVMSAPPNQRWVGMYIRLNDVWQKITAVSSANRTLTLENAVAASGVEVTKAVTMNEISITGQSLTLTRLNLLYTPRIA